MDRGVNHVRCGVQETVLATIDHLAVVVDQDEVGLVYQRERCAERVDPGTSALVLVLYCYLSRGELGRMIYQKQSGCTGSRKVM